MTSPTDLKSRLMAAVDGIIKRGPGEPLVNLIEDLIDTVVEQSEALEDACETIHGEFCGHEHHPLCIKPNQALTATQARLQKWVGE